MKKWEIEVVQRFLGFLRVTEQGRDARGEASEKLWSLHQPAADSQTRHLLLPYG